MTREDTRALAVLWPSICLRKAKPPVPSVPRPLRYPWMRGVGVGGTERAVVATTCFLFGRLTVAAGTPISSTKDAPWGTEPILPTLEAPRVVCGTNEDLACATRLAV